MYIVASDDRDGARPSSCGPTSARSATIPPAPTPATRPVDGVGGERRHRDADEERQPHRLDHGARRARVLGQERERDEDERA